MLPATCVSRAPTLNRSPYLFPATVLFAMRLPTLSKTTMPPPVDCPLTSLSSITESVTPRCSMIPCTWLSSARRPGRRRLPLSMLVLPLMTRWSHRCEQIRPWLPFCENVLPVIVR